MANDLLPGGVIPPGESPSFNFPPPKKIIPGAQEKLEATGVKRLLPGAGKAIDPNAKTKLAARGVHAGAQKAEPGFEGLEEVKMDAAEPGFEGLAEVDPGFEGLAPADRLDYDTTDNLAKDDNFRPAQYIAEHPEVTKDGAKFQKLLDAYRQKRVTGLEVGKVLKSAAHEAPGILAKTVKGAVDLGERFLDVAVQPAANAFIGGAMNLSPEELEGIQAEAGKQQLKAAGEVTAGTEQAITGLTQLGTEGARKLFGKAPKDMTDDELYDQLLVDAEFHKATQDISQGKGDLSKATGLDADFLAKNGVELDQDAIANLSLVDPVTLVATAGVFKVVGIGGKILATAATRVGAEAVVNGLKTAAAKSLQVAGRGAELAGQGVQKLPLRTPSLVAVGGQLAAGDVGGALLSAAAPPVIRAGGRALAAAGRTVAEAGEQLAPGFVGPRSAGLARIAELAASPAGQVTEGAVKGAVAGTVAAAPLAAASQDSQTAGALLGGGAILGATAGGVAAGKNAVANAVAKRYLDPHSIPFEAVDSPGYGIDGNLDKTHEAAINALPESERNAINNFREAIRKQGGEIYVQDQASFLERVRESMMTEQGGQPLTPAQEAQAKLYADSHAFFDGYLTDAAGQERRAIFLNNSAKGLPHDAGHLFQAMLAPEHQANLRKTALDAYTPEQLTEFADAYAKRIGEPDYFNKLGEEAAKNKIADELIAENFGQLFGNTKFADLKAPPGFLQQLGQFAAEAGEALGIDLKAGRMTPDLQAQPSFRLQNILRNAAREVLNLPEAEPRAPFIKQGELELPTAEPPKPAELPTAEAAKAVTPEEVVTPEAPKTPVVDETAARATERGVDEARTLTKGNPEAAQTVETIAASMEAGNPVLRIEHRGITQEPGAPRETGRTSRRGTQKEGYEALEALQVENRKEAPPEVVSVHEKTFVPVRFTEQGGKATLIAMSMDKVLANLRRVVADAFSKDAADLIPYAQENGKLTTEGWNQALADLQVYAENQSNGYRGDGQKLVRPGDELGASIPAENPDYTPQPLGEAQANFANLIQGIAPPKTARAPKGGTPGNIKGQVIAELQGRTPEKPAVVRPQDLTKQAFGKPFEGREVAETNPLRNELDRRGVNTRALTEVTERLAAEDIGSVEPSKGPQVKAPVTDVIRGGFLPKDAPAADIIDRVLSSTADEWRKMFGPQQAQASRAYEVGLGLKSPEELAALKSAREQATEAGKAILELARGGDMDALNDMSIMASKAQFFREAIEAATDTGSAAGAQGWRKYIPDGKPPFAEKERSFLPKTEAAREAAEKGFEITVTGKPGKRGVTVKKDGIVVGEIVATEDASKQNGAFVTNASLKKAYRGQGLAEAAYRELLAQLKEDGVTEIGGGVVAPQPLAIRRKIFGDENTKVRDERGEVPIDQALQEFNEGSLGFNVTNEIKPEMSFLPGEGERDFEVVWKPRKGGVTTLRQKISAASPEEAQAKANLPASAEVVSVEETFKPTTTGPSDLIPLTAENESLVRDRKHLPSDKEVTDALSEDKKEFVGEHRDLEPGTPVGLRIDIPAYNRTGTYVITVHEKAKGGSVGKRIGYDSVATVDNPTFFSNEKGAEKIKAGAAKFPIATVEGEFNPSRSIPQNLDGWTEVGYNPTKHSYFYEKGTEEPVVSGSKAVSAGNTVYVKDPVYGNKKDFKFLPSEEGVTPEDLTTPEKGRAFLPKPGTPEYNDYVANRIEESKKFPEAIPLDAVKTKEGNFKSEYKDEPNWIREPWAFNETPLAKENRVEGNVVESENKYTDALGKRLEEAYHEAKKNPAVEAGETWYSVAREKIQTLLGKDAQLFAELLGATSPNTAVDVNFGYAVEAYNLLKQGFYDSIIEKYREGRAKFQAGELDEFTKDTGKTGKKATEKAFLSWWADKNNLEPTSNRKKPDGSLIKFGMHTDSVLRVLDRTWLQQVEGPKTPNFTGNLSGASFEATIDKWAARLVHRLSNEGFNQGQPWRIQPPAETGVSDRDFFTAQKAFRKAGDALGVSPDALQAILWFMEKEHWEKNGWTTTTGAAKADYNVLLRSANLSPEGKLTYTKVSGAKPKGAKKAKAAVSPEDLETEKPVDKGPSPSDIE